MNKYCCIILFALMGVLGNQLFAQDTLIKDLDFDRVCDTVYFDKGEATLVCKLSTQQFEIVQSQPISGTEYALSHVLRSGKKGFEFISNYTGFGEGSEFMYERESKKIRLIGLRRQGSDLNWFGANGSSHLNLLNNKYVGRWQYNDKVRDEYLIEMPVIKSKIYFYSKIYLEEYSASIHYSYDKFCTSIFVEHRNKHREKYNKQK